MRSFQHRLLRQAGATEKGQQIKPALSGNGQDDGDSIIAASLGKCSLCGSESKWADQFFDH